MTFRNREHAGERLAAMLDRYRDEPDVLVLALPRGGVPVAAVITRELRAPLDIFLVRKIGVPGHEELAAGAIAEGHLIVLNDEVVRAYRIPDAVIDAIARREEAEIERQALLFRADRSGFGIENQNIILVDDGVATGSTIIAAARALRGRRPSHITIAVPVAARTVADVLRTEADELVCAIETDVLNGVSMWYDDFRQVPDDEVRRILG
jgi:predicted phosphoribosyltransferase